MLRRFILQLSVTLAACLAATQCAHADEPVKLTLEQAEKQAIEGSEEASDDAVRLTRNSANSTGAPCVM